MTYDWDNILSKLGFGNGPAWTPGYLSRLEERACWLHKVFCLDSQVQNLEAASFFGRAARQHDGALLQLPCYLQSSPPAAGPAEGSAGSPSEARGEQEAPRPAEGSAASPSAARPAERSAASPPEEARGKLE